MNKKFASNFKPIFRACDLGKFCLTNLSEKTELEFLLRYKLFSRLKSHALISSHSQAQTSVFKPLELKNDHKELIKFEIATHLAAQKDKNENLLTFNDGEVIEKVNKKIFENEKEKTDDQILIKTLDDYEDQQKSKRIKLNEENEDDDDQLLIQALINFEKDQEEKRINKERYKEATKTFVSMQRGVHLEELIIERVNKLENMFFKKSNELISKDFDLFKICGIVDGIDVDAQTIIEIKTKNRLSSSVKAISSLEWIQCLCYMNFLNFSKCILVESGPNGEQNLFRIDYDESAFKCKVLDRLKRFVEKYRNIGQDDFVDLLKKYSFLL